MITKIEIKNPFNIKEFAADKQSGLDIKALDSTGKPFNIEMQTGGTNIFRNRSLYYWAKLYSSQLLESDKWRKLMPAISINALDYVFFKEHQNLRSYFVPTDWKSGIALSNHLFNLDDELTSFINQVDDPEKLNKALDSLVSAGTAKEILESLKDQ